MTRQEELAKLIEMQLILAEAEANSMGWDDDAIENFFEHGTIPHGMIPLEEPLADCTSSDYKIDVSELENIELSYVKGE